MRWLAISYNDTYPAADQQHFVGSTSFRQDLSSTLRFSVCVSVLELRSDNDALGVAVN